MKTGTLTFHAPNNNGSFLQAFALQQVLLREYSVQNQIIDFVSERQEHQYSVLRKPESVKDIGRNMISLLHRKDLEKRACHFENMRQKYLAMTPRVTTEQEALELAEQFDILICGSDQIWNCTARDFSPAYFLPGVDKKKVAYAVSCGSSVSENDDLFRNIESFSAVSVREPELKRQLEGMGITGIEVTCDPTLLLEQKDYYTLYHRFPILHGDYILLYTINYDDEALRLTKELADKFNLPVYAPFTGYSAVKCAKYGIKVLYNIAPDGFLNLMHHAKYVVSNSFHGIAFSIIYEKHFFRPVRLDDKDQFVRDDRIDGLLEELGLEDQRVFHHSDTLVFSERKPDYCQTGRTKAALRNLQANSYLYLNRVIEEDKNVL